MPLPNDFLQKSYQHVRKYGGLCIADEIQVGFGRTGKHMWAFELQGVVPDIVTLGKPIGNGHPLGAVITTREIAKTFANGMEYFNTFGGSQVSSAVGMAVLDVMEKEGLMQNSLENGRLLKKNLEELKKSFPLISCWWGFVVLNSKVYCVFWLYMKARRICCFIHFQGKSEKIDSC